MDFRKNKLPRRFDVDMTPLHDFMRQMDTFFNHSFKHLNEHFHLQPFWVDVKEDDTHFVIHAELNGYKREQIQIKVAGNRIWIGIEDYRVIDQKDLKNNVNQKRQNFTVKERVVSLPFDIPKNDIKASFKNQVLTITIPKKYTDSSNIHIQES